MLAAVAAERVLDDRAEVPQQRDIQPCTGVHVTMTTDLNTPVVEQDRRVVVAAVAGAVGVVLYVGSWAIAGVLWDGYDPARQAISELFALGAPPAPRWLVSAGLIVSAVGLVVFGWALDRGLPGRGRLGPALAMLSGVMTLGVVAFPCSAGCPGMGETLTDTGHVVTATVGYLALILAPLAIGWRVRQDLPGFAAASWIIGGLALALLLVRTAGFAPDLSGLQQRVFNTIADAWYLVAAVVLVRRNRHVAR